MTGMNPPHALRFDRISLPSLPPTASDLWLVVMSDDEMAATLGLAAPPTSLYVLMGAILALKTRGRRVVKTSRSPLAPLQDS
jgi:hypothetical protein